MSAITAARPSSVRTMLPPPAEGPAVFGALSEPRSSGRSSPWSDTGGSVRPCRWGFAWGAFPRGFSLDPPIIVDESLSWARSRVDRRRTLRVAPLEAADRRWAVIHGWDSPRESVDPG